MRAMARWLNEETWVCLAHMRAVRLPASAGSCWYAGCKTCRPTESFAESDEVKDFGRRQFRPGALPERAQPKSNYRPPVPRAKRRPTPAPAPSRPVLVTELTHADQEHASEACEWHKCSNTARPGSKYCSRNCSNKNARRRHKMRKKTEARQAA